MNHRESLIVGGNPIPVKLTSQLSTMTVSPRKLRLPKLGASRPYKENRGRPSRSAPVPFRFGQFVRLERKPSAEFTDERTGNECAVWVDEAGTGQETSRTRSIVYIA